MLKNVAESDTCVCKHSRNDHFWGFKSRDMTPPYCIIKKCSCSRYQAKPPPKPEDTAGILLLARDYIVRQGWCQGWTLKQDGSVDITTAILYACDWRKDREKKALEHLFTIIPQNLMKWNDADDRTVDDVIELLTLGASLLHDKDDKTVNDVAPAGDADAAELGIEGCS